MSSSLVSSGIDTDCDFVRFRILIPTCNPSNDRIGVSIVEVHGYVESVVVVGNPCFRPLGGRRPFLRLTLYEPSFPWPFPDRFREPAVDVDRIRCSYCEDHPIRAGLLLAEHEGVRRC